MKRGRKLASALLSLAVFLSTAVPHAGAASAAEPEAAPDLGVLDSRTMELAPDVTYTWRKLNYGSGQQQVHAVEFDPALPHLDVQSGKTYGKVYGMQGVSGMAAAADGEGNRVIAATNGDFYDLSTGIPSGLYVADGTILNTPAGNQRAFGVKADGTAVIGQPKVQVELTAGGQTVPIQHINRLRGNHDLILYTSDFYSSTKTNSQGDELVLEVLEGEVQSGSSLKVRVLEKRIGQGDTPLQEGQAVLSAAGTARAIVQGLEPGDEAEISFALEGEWHDVRMAVGANQLLVQDGAVVHHSDAAIHPRTAVGIKADGSIVLLTVDGRSPGFSEGVTLAELGEIMLSMGAVDAVNLDGGGSTTFIARLPGDAERTLLNRPSDGGERSTANGILLVNTAPEGPAQALAVRPNLERVLAGSSVAFTASAVDAHGHPAAFDGSLAWSVNPVLGTVDEAGVFTAGETAGMAVITAEAGGLTGQAQIEVVDELTELKFPEAVRSVETGATITLQVTALRNGQVIQADNDQFEWRVEGPIGTIDEQGRFTATNEPQQEGKVYVKYGDVEASMTITVGVPPVVLEDFEQGLDRYLVTSGANFVKSIASITTEEEFVRFGNQALKLEYDFTGTTGTSGAYLAVNGVENRVPIPGYPEKISMWVYGDGNGHWLRLQIRDGNGAAVPVDLTEISPGVDWVGWKYVEGEVPQGRPLPLSIDQIVRYMETNNDKKDAGVIYVDQIRALYGPVDEDITPPTIDRLSPEDGSTVTDNRPTIAAYAVDDLFDPEQHQGTTFIDPESIRLYVNGEQVEGYGFYVPEGRISYTPSEPLPEGVNTVKLQLKDLAGNRAVKEWSFYVDSGAPKFAYATPEQVYAGNTSSLDVSLIQPSMIRSGTIEFEFDLSKVEDLQVIKGEKLSDHHLASSVDTVTGSVYMQFTDVDTLPLTEEDVLAQVQYTVKPSATGENTILFRSASIEFADGRSSGFIGLPAVSEIHHHLRLSWNEDGRAQGFTTIFTVTDESGAAVEGADIVTTDGTSYGTTDANGVLETNALTQIVGEYQIQAVKGTQYSLVHPFEVLPHGGTPEPYNINVTMGLDPARSRSLTWHTDPNTTETVVQYVKESEFAGFDQGNVQSVTGISFIFNTFDIGAIRVHQAELTGLSPGTTYVYRVGDGAGHFSGQGTFTTAEETGDALKFLFIGDSQAADEAGYALWGSTVRKAFADHPDAEFLIHAGDMVDSGFREAEWNMWFSAAQEELMNTTLVAVIGNHEVMGTKGNGDFLAHFLQPQNGIDSLKGTSFSFDYHDAHFVVLNSEYDYEAQAEWLESDLAATDRKWKIAVFHRGPYGSQYDTEIVRALWTPIFDRFDVDLVLNGHDHIYLRTFPMNGGSAVEPGEGTVYVVGGSSGPKFYGKTDRPWQEVVFDEPTQVYSVIEINGDQLKLTAKTVFDDRYVDEFVLAKGEDVPEPVLSRIELQGIGSSLLEGETAQAAVEAVYSDGRREIVNDGVTFASSDESILTVSADGLVTAVNRGSASIMAEYEGKQASVTVTVTPFMLVVEDFEDTDGLSAFQVNSAPVTLETISRPETIYYGHHAVKMTYDFTGQPGTSAAYVRLLDPESGQIGRKLEGRPKRIGLWVYGDAGNHWLRAELQDAAGVKIPVDFTSTTGLSWNGWRYVTAEVPSTMQQPIQINQVYAAQLRAEYKNSGSLIFDQLSAFYTDSPIYGLDLAGVVPMTIGETIRVSVFQTEQHSTEPVLVTEGVTFASDNEAVAVVQADGTVRAISTGTANLSASLNGMRMAVETVRVTEGKIVPTSLQYSVQSEMETGASQQIRLYAVYETPEEELIQIVDGAVYTSSQPSVAAVDDSGLLQALSSGKAEITVEYEGLSETFTVTVREPVPVLQSIQLSALPAMAAGESRQLKVYGIYTHLPEPVEITEGVVFESRTPSVATVDAAGNVQALSVGTTLITATYEGKFASFTLPVIADRSVPKAEMRAAWIATVDNIDWPKKGVVDPEQQKQDFIALLDELQANGINAAIVQIKPTGDAFYPSAFAPWSEWLTGEQGKDPGYDPLAFMIEEVHKRNMEFHAWMNPYRLSIQGDVDHLVEDHPARAYKIIEYGDRLYLDPGQPEAQQYIIDSIMEVVENYDIDAIHFDDYFYPYPVSGVDFPDEETYQRYKGEFTNKADWRRNNVDTFILNLSREIKAAKPHVKFGISPFGIWRNKSQDPEGSDTNGLSSYDAIFADSKGWVENPEIKLDYIVPQIYWNFGYTPAAYEVLAEWWSDVTAGHNIHLYTGNALHRIGTDSPAEWLNPEEVPNQLLYNRNFDQVKGAFFFSAKGFPENPLGFSDRLKGDLYRYPALIPSMPWLDDTAPAAPVLEGAQRTEEGVALTWRDGEEESDAAYYVIYRFAGDEAGSLDDPRNIVDTVRKQAGAVQSYIDSGAAPDAVYTYVITAVDRLHNESAASNAVTAGGEEDDTPPETAAVFSGTERNGWFVSPVEILLEAQDQGSGVAETVYSFDHGETWQRYEGVIRIEQDGIYTLSYRSVDRAGNEEAAKEAAFQVDLTPPSLVIHGARMYEIDERVIITCEAADTVSGVVYSPCAAPLVNAYAYEIGPGDHTVTVQAEDGAGNVGTATAVYTVEAVDIIVMARLIGEYVTGPGDTAIERLLVRHIVEGRVDVFVKQIRALAGTKLTEEQAERLAAIAEKYFK